MEIAMLDLEVTLILFVQVAISIGITKLMSYLYFPP